MAVKKNGKQGVTAGGPGGEVRTGLNAAALEETICDHLRYSLGRLPTIAQAQDY